MYTVTDVNLPQCCCYLHFHSNCISFIAQIMSCVSENNEMGVFQKRFSDNWECQTPLPHKRVRKQYDSDSDDDVTSYPEEIRKQYVK